MPASNDMAIHPVPKPDSTSFSSRRSVVHSTDGIVACTQPLAAQAGLTILREGGNAADAAVAVAAALNVTEPTSTGIGGDMFALYYSSDTKKIRALNGSGRAASEATLDIIRKELGIKDHDHPPIPISSAHAVTTPGAAAGWVDVVENFGNHKLSMEQILGPAIQLAEHGFPVSELASFFWKQGEQSLRDASPNFAELLKNDPTAKGGYRAPRSGEIFKNPNLASTFRRLAKSGKKEFYEGFVAESIVKAVGDRGGHLSLEDLKSHGERGSEEVEPISIKFKGQSVRNSRNQVDDEEQNQTDSDGGVEIWECPPNGQGIVALIALGILQELEQSKMIRKFNKDDHNSAEYLHAIIESLRIAFADGTWFVADPAVEKVPIQELLSSRYLAERAKLFDPKRASHHLQPGSPAHNHSDTVYFAVTDQWGNGISFINSNFAGFGSGIVPAGCGLTLQNRGAGFSLDKNHPNVFAPGKRPYHTIIPSMITNPSDGSLHTVFGVMGGFMQPQGHVQVLLNMLAFRFNPQVALDAPRFCIGAGTPDQGKVLSRTIYLEEGVDEEVAGQLEKMGHKVKIIKGWTARGLLGRGQVIRVHFEDEQMVYSAGSDPRGDGAAVPL
ncbi:MAG: hypothetical protein M1816_001759 [Peltula sp. TS41687]|nr:MAG: hypothetical protein M1816_001759 [Peltula sp. TS41687]